MAGAGDFRDIVVTTQVITSVKTSWRGNFAEAIAMARDTASARDVHDGFNELFAMSNRCFGHIALGEYREALDLLVETRALAAERESCRPGG